MNSDQCPLDCKHKCVAPSITQHSGSHASKLRYQKTFLASSDCHFTQQMPPWNKHRMIQIRTRRTNGYSGMILLQVTGIDWNVTGYEKKKSPTSRLRRHQPLPDRLLRSGQFRAHGSCMLWDEPKAPRVMERFENRKTWFNFLYWLYFTSFTFYMLLTHADS